MTESRFEAVASAAVARIGAARLRALAASIASGVPDEIAAHAVPVPGFAEVAREVLAAYREAGLSRAAAAAYLRGVAAGYAQRSAMVRVESVWSGPSTHRVPVRASAQVLTDLVRGARHELLLVTYSARPYRPLRQALTEAIARGVSVDVVVETLDGAGGALDGAEPAEAFAGVPGVRLWHWPKEQRPGDSAKMHAKIAVADRHVLLVSSANLTQSGVAHNIEAGVLIRGGTAPSRAAEHIAELQAKGVLALLGSGR